MTQTLCPTRGETNVYHHAKLPHEQPSDVGRVLVHTLSDSMGVGDRLTYDLLEITT